MSQPGEMWRLLAANPLSFGLQQHVSIVIQHRKPPGWQIRRVLWAQGATEPDVLQDHVGITSARQLARRIIHSRANQPANQQAKTQEEAITTTNYYSNNRQSTRNINKHPNSYG